jgi:hypothetical protein
LDIHIEKINVRKSRYYFGAATMGLREQGTCMRGACGLTPVIAIVKVVVCLLGRRRRVLAGLLAGGLPATAVVLREPLSAASLGLIKLSKHMKPSPKNRKRTKLFRRNTRYVRNIYVHI